MQVEPRDAVVVVLGGGNQSRSFRFRRAGALFQPADGRLRVGDILGQTVSPRGIPRASCVAWLMASSRCTRAAPAVSSSARRAAWRSSVRARSLSSAAASEISASSCLRVCSEASRVWRGFSSATTAFLFSLGSPAHQALSCSSRSLRAQACGLFHRGFVGPDFVFQIPGAPFQLAEVAPQGQRTGAGSLAARNHAMVVLRSRRRQKVAVRISTGQSLRGCIILHNVGVGEGRQHQIAIQAQLGFETHQLPDRRHDPGSPRDGVAVPMRMPVGGK